MSFKPNLSVTLTAEQERLWSNAIGGIMLNFGQVEFTSHRWIQHFSRDPLIGDLAIDMQFSKRLQLIRELLARAELSSEVRSRALELWTEAGKLSETRNRLAHNPMVFAPGPDGQLIPGIPNVKHMKGSGPFTITVLDSSQIIHAARRLGEIAAELDQLLAEPSDETRPTAVT
jgi:hypothetical protein